jgi:hypothetical protein
MCQNPDRGSVIPQVKALDNTIFGLTYCFLPSAEFFRNRFSAQR